MKFCSECNYEMRDDANFCGRCGRPLAQQSSSSTAKNKTVFGIASIDPNLISQSDSDASADEDYQPNSSHTQLYRAVSRSRNPTPESPRTITPTHTPTQHTALLSPRKETPLTELPDAFTEEELEAAEALEEETRRRHAVTDPLIHDFNKYITRKNRNNAIVLATTAIIFLCAILITYLVIYLLFLQH